MRLHEGFEPRLHVGLRANRRRSCSRIHRRRREAHDVEVWNMRVRIPMSWGRTCGCCCGEYPDISELSKQVRKNLSGATDTNLPSRAQPLRNEPVEMLPGDRNAGSAWPIECEQLLHSSLMREVGRRTMRHCLHLSRRRYPRRSSDEAYWFSICFVNKSAPDGKCMKTARVRRECGSQNRARRLTCPNSRECSAIKQL
jgi:hypothetical protein